MTDDVDRTVGEGVMSEIAGIGVHPGIIACERTSNSIRPGTRSGCNDMLRRKIDEDP